MYRVEDTAFKYLLHMLLHNHIIIPLYFVCLMKIRYLIADKYYKNIDRTIAWDHLTHKSHSSTKESLYSLSCNLKINTIINESTWHFCLPKTNTTSGLCSSIMDWNAWCICHSRLHLSNQCPSRGPNKCGSAKMNALSDCDSLCGAFITGQEHWNGYKYM